MSLIPYRNQNLYSVLIEGNEIMLDSSQNLSILLIFLCCGSSAFILLKIIHNFNYMQLVTSESGQSIGDIFDTHVYLGKVRARGFDFPSNQKRTLSLLVSQGFGLCHPKGRDVLNVVIRMDCWERVCRCAIPKGKGPKWNGIPERNVFARTLLRIQFSQQIFCPKVEIFGGNN